jgi:thioredoxin 1
MAGNIIEITKDNFDDVRTKNKNLVIDCWAAWCGPCKMMGPIFEKLATENGSRTAFGKIDCDKNPELARKLKVMAIPTLLFFKDGDNVDEIVGLVPKEDIEETLRKHF